MANCELMHIISKIIGLLTQPALWVVAILVTALWCKRCRPGTRQALIVAALLVLLGVGLVPLPDFGLRHLEQQYPEISPQQDLSGYHGVVVLGGAMESGHVSQHRQLPLLNSAAERMTATVALARSQPHLRIVFTGGEGHLFGSGQTEAERAQKFFASMGLAPGRVLLEDQSRNTYDNAVMTAKLPGVDPTQRWLLLTSAWHMPRSMATFRKAGWNVTAYPVDFRTGPSTPWTVYDTSLGIERWDLLLHEWIGLLAYRLTGRS